MSDIGSDNLGEATPGDAAEAATEAHSAVDVGMGEDAGTVGDADRGMPADQADAVVT